MMLRRHNNKLVFLSCFRSTTSASDGASQAVLGPRRKDNMTNLSALGVSPSQSHPPIKLGREVFGDTPVVCELPSLT